jgi:hypothetical protein
MSLVQDAGLENLATTLGCKLKQAPQILTRTLNRVERVATPAYRARVNAIEKFREHRDSYCKDFDAKLAELETLETDLTMFLQPASEDLKDLQTDAIGQLSFQDEYFKSLNAVPYVLFGMSLFKIWAVPLMAVLTPLIAWVIPFIFLKFLYRLPISADQYTGILRLLWSGAPLSFTPGTDGRPIPVMPSLFSPRSLAQTAVFLFSFAQGLIQPIQNAWHLYKTDRTIVENGQKAIRLFTLYKDFTGTCSRMGVEIPFRESLDDMPLDDPRQAIHLLLEQPRRLTLAFRDLADLEILWRMSQFELLAPATVSETGDYPTLRGIGIVDLSLPPEIAVPSDVNFTGRSHHAALTGPNGGGKSSFLRGVLQSVLLAQAYGVAPAEALFIRRFGWISSGLRLQDSPGTLSMFETEVWFASRLLQRSSTRGPGLVLYDELFHSTNPPDGIATADLFLGRLWSRSDVVSIVSTHVFELVEKAPEDVQRLCCQAEAGDDGELAYGFAVETGICRLSSVRSIWRRMGLVGTAAAPQAAVPAKPENLPAKEK